MTIVKTHYRGTPARPRAQEVSCLRTAQGHAHVAAADSYLTLEVSTRDGSVASMSLTIAESRRLAELLEKAPLHVDNRSDSQLRVPAAAVNAV